MEGRLASPLLCPAARSHGALAQPFPLAPKATTGEQKALSPLSLLPSLSLSSRKVGDGTWREGDEGPRRLCAGQDPRARGRLTWPLLRGPGLQTGGRAHGHGRLLCATHGPHSALSAPGPQFCRSKMDPTAQPVGGSRPGRGGPLPLRGPVLQMWNSPDPRLSLGVRGP